MRRRDSDAWKTVLSALEQHILAGTLHPGDRLPPERALASELSVPRSAVQEALRVLEVLGIVRTDNSRDTGAIFVSSPAGGMGSIMRLQIAAHNIDVEDVVRTRLILETSIVDTLATNVETSDLSKVTELLDAMEEPDLTKAEFLALDAQFHLSLAEAADNHVISAVMAGLRSSIEAFSLQGSLGLVGWATMVDRLRTEHRGIAMAVIDGDAELAAKRVHAHISQYYADAHLVAPVQYQR